MVVQNELINNEANTQLNEHPAHRSWLGTIIEKIQELDSEFPLSGGEDGHHRVIKQQHHHHTPPKKETVKEKVQVPETAKHHHTSWFSKIINKIQNLDADFPLSGGEHTR